MKSKTSCFSKTIFRKNITHFWPIWCLFLLFYLFIMPFSEFIGYLGEKAGYDTGKTLAEKMAESILIPETIQIVFNPVILLIFSLIAAGAVFSYLYTSRASYTMHAFPVTRTSLFITNYVSGLLFLWGPMLLGGLLGILVAAGCGYSYIEILFKGVLCAMGISLFFYSFNVFIGILVGQLIAMPVFSLILNFLFVGSKYILTQLFSCFAYGISGEYQNGVLDVLSPLYYISSHIRVNIQYSGGWSKAVCTGMTGAKMVAGYALAAVVFLVLAFVLYQRRHLETAGNLIAFSWITPLFRWGVGACFASLGAMTAGSIMFSSNSGTKRFVMILMAGIVVGVLFFFAAEMVLQKSFRVFAKKRFREIEKIIALHENILSHKALYQNIESPWEDGYGINLKYYMKDGSVLTRYYVVAQDESARSDENSPVSVARAYMREGETYKKNVLGLNYKDNKYLYGNINFPEKVAKDDYGNPITSSTSREFTAEQSEKICEAFMKDVDAGNFKNQWYSGEAEKYDKLVFENTISFSYTNSKGYEEYSDRFYSGRNYAYVMDSGNAYIQFNTECENIIQALIDMEMIKSPDELITRWDMEQTPLPEE